MSINLRDVGSGYKRTSINANFTDIENEINNNLLSKNGGVGLEADLDANSQKVINLADGIVGSDAVNLRQLNGAINAAGSGLIASQTEVQLGSEAVANVFTLSSITYTVGGNNLYVFRNGQKLGKGEDYTETSTSSITLTFTPNANDRFEFITNISTTNSVTDTSAITHTEGSTNYNLATYLQNRHVVNVKDFGAVGDGSLQTTEIQSAINYAELNGFRDVVVPKGTYLYTTLTLTGTRLVGEGVMIKSSSSEDGIIMLGDGSAVIDLTFNPQSTTGQPNTDIKFGDGCVNPVVDNCTFNGDIYSAIGAAEDLGVGGTDYPYTNNVVNVKITNNRFTGYTRPVYLFCIDRYEISGNYFTDSDFDAIRLRETAGEGIIDNNIFYEVGDQAWPDSQTRDCIDTAHSGDKLIITNNIMIRPAYKGIDIKGIGVEANNGYSSKNIIITGNYIEGARYSGISIEETSTHGTDFIWGMLVNQNIIVGCNRENELGGGSVADAGIIVGGGASYLDVSHNQVYGCYGRGISVARDSANTNNVKNSSVTFNKCYNNNSSGIYFQMPVNCTIIGNNSGNDTSTYVTSPLTGSKILPDGGGQDFGYTFVTGDSDSRYNNIFSLNTGIDNNTSPISFSGSGSYSDVFVKYGDNNYSGNDANFALSNRERWAQEGKRIFWGNGSAPASSEGTFLQGDIIYNVAPSAGGYIGLVCVTGGNPGTWKTFGAISA